MFSFEPLKLVAKRLSHVVTVKHPDLANDGPQDCTIWNVVLDGSVPKTHAQDSSYEDTGMFNENSGQF
jgi:hypothetical protein